MRDVLEIRVAPLSPARGARVRGLDGEVVYEFLEAAPGGLGGPQWDGIKAALRLKFCLTIYQGGGTLCVGRWAFRGHRSCFGLCVGLPWSFRRPGSRRSCFPSLCRRGRLSRTRAQRLPGRSWFGPRNAYSISSSAKAEPSDTRSEWAAPASNGLARRAS
jgi:hypothetical protein